MTEAALATVGGSGIGGGKSATVATIPSQPARPMTQIDATNAAAFPTGIGEFDRVLGKGIVPGSVMLLAGEPGVGKSTLLLEAVKQWALQGRRALYVTGEESAGQVRLRAERTGAVHDEIYLAAETDLGAVLGHAEAVMPSLMVVDSVQTMIAQNVDGVNGGVTQIRAVTTALTSLAKNAGIAVILVGHVTKDGTVAGPRSLEHLVDVVLSFEGDKHSPLRMVRGIKNRFGSADEVGCFEQREDGIHEVTDPSELFLHHRDIGVAGTAITVAMDGKRPLLGEVQALVSKSSLANPRRAVVGLDSARVAMILAVCAARANLPTYDQDVYVATVGGMKISEPAADLSVALALSSILAQRSLPGSMVAHRRDRSRRRGAPGGRGRPPGGRGEALGLQARNRSGRIAWTCRRASRSPRSPTFRRRCAPHSKAPPAPSHSDFGAGRRAPLLASQALGELDSAAPLSRQLSLKCSAGSIRT